jgi:hypothetical protein
MQPHVGKDIPPRVVIAELSLDLKLDTLEEDAFDAHAAIAPRELTAGRLAIVAYTYLGLRACVQVETQSVSNAQRGAIGPAEDIRVSSRLGGSAVLCERR